MQLIEVTDQKTRKLFHKVPHIIYRNDPNWICPLNLMVENVFNPDKNPSFKNGEAIRWILMDDNKKPIGRIAAFYNLDKAGIFEQPTGGCGFFECINSQEAAELLFNSSRDWLKSKGMEAMDGPVNFGENYMNWGLLADGYMPQGFGMPYNPPYYVELFEKYGFKIYFKQFSYHLDTTLPELPDRFWNIAEWVAKKPQFSFNHFYWQEKELIMAKLKGRITLFNFPKVLWQRRRKSMTRTRSLIIGIGPKFQRSGIEAAIFWHLRPAMYKKRWYREMELSWAGDFNPKIVSLYESVGGKRVKTHYTMRYLFDRDKPFVRAPVITAGAADDEK